MLKKIFESTFIMGTSSIAVMLLDLVRVKILAVLLGPQGVGVLSVLNHFHTLAATLVGLGLGTGITKYVASLKSEGNTIAVQKVLSNSFQIVFIFSSIVLAASVFFSSRLSTWMLGESGFAIFIIIYALSLPLAVYPTTMNSFLQGLKRINSLAKINVLRTSISLVFIIPMVFFFRLKGAVISVLVITVVHLLLAAYYLSKENHPYGVIHWQSFDPGLLKKLFQYGGTSLLVGTAYYLSHLLLKLIIVDSLGLEMNGIYQPIWALTMTYLTLVLSSMSAYAYPRLCELANIRDITEELNGILRIAFLLITPVMFLLLLARKPVIYILYSSNFLPATEYMPIQILGDFFKILFWATGMYLLPTKRLLGFIWLNLLQDTLLVVLANTLVTRYQLHGIALSFALSYFIAFLALYIYSKNQIGFSLWTMNRKLLSASFGTLLAIILCEKYLSFWPFIAVVCLAIFVWSVVSIRKEEVLQLKGYLSGKFKRSGLSEGNLL